MKWCEKINTVALIWEEINFSLAYCDLFQIPQNCFLCKNKTFFSYLIHWMVPTTELQLISPCLIMGTNFGIDFPQISITSSDLNSLRYENSIFFSRKCKAYKYLNVSDVLYLY